jgi:hypothetical protein
MALAAKQHTAIDAELQRIQEYLSGLAIQIDAAAPLADKYGFTYQVALNLVEQVELLRDMLVDEQRKRQPEAFVCQGEHKHIGSSSS